MVVVLLSNGNCDTGSTAESIYVVGVGNAGEGVEYSLQICPGTRIQITNFCIAISASSRVHVS